MTDKVVPITRAPNKRLRSATAAAKAGDAMSSTTPAEVRKLMLQKLAGSMLTEKDAKLLGFHPTTERDTATLPAPLPFAVAGFVIPYFNLHGKKSEFWRFRYLKSTNRGFKAHTDAKEIKYMQPKRTLNELYLPPFIKWPKVAADPTMPLLITEGELKAACASKLGIPTIGLGGVWCFKSDKRGVVLLDQFSEFEWMGRTVYVVYDSDAVTNPMVMAAEGALCMALSRLGAKPHVVRLPDVYEDAEQKTGLDDYLLVEGKDALEDILAQTPTWRGIEELHAMNQEVIYVQDPGFVLRLSTMQIMRPKDFVDHAYSDWRHQVEMEQPNGGIKKVLVSTAKEWINWPQRNVASRMTFAPGEDRITRKGEFNTWKGWAVEPEAGSVKLWTELLDNIFADKPDERQWFERWLAYPLQHPGTKMFSSAVVWGIKHGTGKSLIGYSMFRIYGHNSTEIGNKDLHGSYNGWAANQQFVMGDEITGGERRDMSDYIKKIISQPNVTVNEKFVKHYKIPDLINYYFTSNHPDAFFLEDDDRRMFIHEVTAPALPDKFFTAYKKWMIDSDAGPAALFHHLLTLDLGDFNPAARAPMTDSKLEMIVDGKSDIAMFVDGLKRDPDSVLRMDNVKLTYSVWRAEELLRIYDPSHVTRVTVNGLSRELKKAGIARCGNGHPVLTTNGQYRLWAVRDVERLLSLSTVELGKLYDKERGTHEPKKKKF